MKHLKLFEEIDWEEDWDYEEEDPDNIFEINDLIKTSPHTMYWWDGNQKHSVCDNPLGYDRVNRSGVWQIENGMGTRKFKIDDITYCDNLKGYHGQLVKLSGKWPWFQITNLKKMD